jgi:hypothetical protein
MLEAGRRHVTYLSPDQFAAADVAHREQFFGGGGFRRGRHP